MTTATADTPFAFDSSPLSCFARAGGMDLLRAICSDVRCVVTEAVRHELRRGMASQPAVRAALEADWIERVRVDGLAELSAFAEYARLLGSARERDVGEAATLAWAETHDAIAIIDERAAVRAARQRKVEHHGTLWLVVRGLEARRPQRGGCRAARRGAARQRRLVPIQ